MMIIIHIQMIMNMIIIQIMMMIIFIIHIHMVFYIIIMMINMIFIDRYEEYAHPKIEIGVKKKEKKRTVSDKNILLCADVANNTPLRLETTGGEARQLGDAETPDRSMQSCRGCLYGQDRVSRCGVVFALYEYVSEEDDLQVRRRHRRSDGDLLREEG